MLKALCILFLILGLTGQKSELQLPTNEYESFETKIGIANKEVIMSIDLLKKQFTICCKPNRSIFQIIQNFLSNPFFQINQFACPKQPQISQFGEITLPTLGLISISYDLTQYPECSKGVLGLSKNSVFIKHLPVNYKTFQIQINEVQSADIKKYTLTFGKTETGGLIPTQKGHFYSPDKEIWDIEVESIKLGSLNLTSNSKIVFASNTQGIEVPDSIYQTFLSLFPISHGCKINFDVIYCPCESGIPQNFPSININIEKDFGLEVGPFKMLVADSAICQLLIQRSPDQNWVFDISLFEETSFTFNPKKQTITIIKNIKSESLQNQIIEMPIQLILNCCVILLMCVFVALIIIQIIKRVSGLDEVSDETFQEYMIRKQLSENEAS